MVATVVGSVCLITGEYSPASGGIADHSAYLAAALGARGIRVDVVTSHRPEGVAAGSVTVRDWGRAAAARIAAYVQDSRPDVVHLQYQTAAFGMSPVINALPLLLRAGGSRRPFITTFHDFRPPYLFPKAGRVRTLANHLLLGASDGAIFVDPTDLVRAHPRRPSTWVPIGPGVLPSGAWDRAAARARLGIAADDVVVAHFGFLNASKGLETLLYAAERLLRAGLTLRLLFVGETLGASDPTNLGTAAHLDALASRLELRDQITFTGPLAPADVSATLAAADLAALPYRDGATLNRSTLLTCLAHGIPTVTTYPHPVPSLAPRHRVAPFDDLARWRLDDRVVALVPPENDAALARMIYRLLDDPEHRASLAEAGKTFVAPLTWTALADATLQVYDHILGKSVP